MASREKLEYERNICKEEFSAGMDFDVIQGVELAAIIVIEKHSCVVRGERINQGD